IAHAVDLYLAALFPPHVVERYVPLRFEVRIPDVLEPEREIGVWCLIERARRAELPDAGVLVRLAADTDEEKRRDEAGDLHRRPRYGGISRFRPHENRGVMASWLCILRHMHGKWDLRAHSAFYRDR